MKGFLRHRFDDAGALVPWDDEIDPATGLDKEVAAADRAEAEEAAEADEVRAAADAAFDLACAPSPAPSPPPKERAEP